LRFFAQELSAMLTLDASCAAHTRAFRALSFDFVVDHETLLAD
jgi:hypothetical protein